MAYHPANLAVRFVLELALLASMAYWGWGRAAGALRYLLAVGLLLLGMALWGIFNVPGDRSRSGAAPVPVPGVVRLALELALFGFATWALIDAGRVILGVIFGALVIVHYAASYNRIAWLLGWGGQPPAAS